MNKKLLIILFTFICITCTQNFSYANSELAYKTTPSLNAYISELERIDNDIYILGKTILESTNPKDYDKFKREIQFNREKIMSVRSSLSNYYDNINENNIESRNILALQVALDYFRVALEELDLLIKDNPGVDKYNTLANYFYNKYSASETISWVKSQSK
ncbi:MAG: hypothetical protein ACRC92_06635 [Peptostreptococcaceae bacterium]